MTGSDFRDLITDDGGAGMATTIEANATDPSHRAPVRARWYADPQKRLIAVGAAVLLVVLGLWVALSSSRRKEAFAGRSLNQARAAAEAGNLPLASSELQKLITTYDGTDAAKEAVITLNQVRLVNGQNELAAVGLRDFLATSPGEKFATPASGLLASALENARRYADAAEAYTRAAGLASANYLKAQYLIGAGRSYRAAGKNPEAIRAYRTIVEKYSDTPSMTEAQVRLAEITGGKM
ncbi:MAG: tetratricopeptide repeat protein [Gemmatimonadales bacterium]|nr:tetratricopeptide repeat protein [Gemmatimonadales bacterium]